METDMISQGEFSERSVPCDGCDEPFPPSTLFYVTDYTHEVRYCRKCAEVYASWVASVQAEERVRQRAFDFWQFEMRASCSLRRMPLDFPPRPPRRATNSAAPG